MSSERQLWRVVKLNLGPYGKFVRIESDTENGIPDVIYCVSGHSGWIELKEVAEWPTRQSTRVKVPSLKLEQVMFLESWEKNGGSAYLLLQIHRNYLLLNPKTVRKLWDGILRADLETQAVVVGQHHLPALAIIRVLTNQRG